MMKRRAILVALPCIFAYGLVGRGAQGKPVNTLETNKSVVRDLIERVWRKGRIDELATFWTTDCVNHADPAPEKQGLAALRQYHEGFSQWFRDFDNIVIDIEQQVAERDRVVTQMIMRAIHREKQRAVSLATIRIDRMVAGKIAEHWSVADIAGLMHQLT